MRSHRCVNAEEGRPAPRFPFIALLAPLVVSAVLFIVLRSSYVLVFALLGPVMALSSWWEARRTHRVETERQREEARARDEEDYRSRAHNDQDHLASLQQQFPHPSQWVNLPLWRPQQSNAGPSIRIGTTTQNGPHGTPLLGLPVDVEAPKGIALVGQPRLTEAVWPACVAQVIAHHRRSAPLDIDSLWPETEPPTSRVEVISEGGLTLLLQRCEVESDVDDRIDHVFTMVSHGVSRWFHNGVLQSDTVRLDQLSPHESLWLRNLLGSWFPQPSKEHFLTPAPSRDNLVLQWSEEGWKDLVQLGPHAIIWGQSGAGKTILMSTLIHHLSRRYPPETHQVVIIDFKGASGIGDVKDLPHVVGWVSDLDTEQVQRAFAGITAEIVRRERLFLEHQCRELSDLPADIECPRTLIVIDEVGALLQQQPQWEALLGDIASRGRSLGLHLVLIDQRVSGHIPRHIVANASLRICLRVGDASEASEILHGATPSQVAQLVGAPVGTLAVSDGQRVTMGLVEQSGEGAAQPGRGRPLWKPALPDTVSDGPSTALALLDRPTEQSHDPLDVSSIPSGLVVVTGDSQAGHSTLLQRWAGTFGPPEVGQLVDDLVTMTHQILQGASQLQPLPRLITLDRLDRLARGQSEVFRDWFIEQLLGVAQLLADGPTPSHLVVTVAPHTQEARALTRATSTVIRLRQALPSSYLDDQPPPPASISPPGRILVGGKLAQVYLPVKPPPSAARLVEILDAPEMHSASPRSRTARDSARV